MPVIGLIPRTYNGPFDINIIDSEFMDNSAFTDGGAIAIQPLSLATGFPPIYGAAPAVSVSMQDCEFDRNTANGSGGALSTLQIAIFGIESCDFDANESGQNGGAIDLFVRSDDLSETSLLIYGVIARSRFNRNVCGDYGGAIHIAGTQRTAPLILQRSRLYRNTAGIAGGAVFLDDARLNRVRSRFRRNQPNSIRSA